MSQYEGGPSTGLEISSTPTTSKWSFLVNSAPRAGQLPSDHPCRSNALIQGLPVKYADDGFFKDRPHYHPANAGLWDIQLPSPPYPGSEKSFPRHPSVPKGSSAMYRKWPVAVITVAGVGCYRGPAIFHDSKLQDDGSIVLGSCFGHSRDRKHRDCLHREVRIPLRPYPQPALIIPGPSRQPDVQTIAGASPGRKQGSPTLVTATIVIDEDDTDGEDEFRILKRKEMEDDRLVNAASKRTCAVAANLSTSLGLHRSVFPVASSCASEAATRMAERWYPNPKTLIAAGCSKLIDYTVVDQDEQLSSGRDHSQPSRGNSNHIDNSNDASRIASRDQQVWTDSFFRRLNDQPVFKELRQVKRELYDARLQNAKNQETIRQFEHDKAQRFQITSVPTPDYETLRKDNERLTEALDNVEAEKRNLVSDKYAAENEKTATQDRLNAQEDTVRKLGDNVKHLTTQLDIAKKGRKEARAARDTAETRYRSMEEKYDALREKAAEYRYKLKEAGVPVEEDDDEKNDDE